MRSNPHACEPPWSRLGAPIAIRLPVVLLALLMLATTGAEAQQSRVGQQVQVHGVPYEIVEFAVLGFADGAAYQVLMPAELSQDEPHETLRANIYVFRVNQGSIRSSSWGDCEQPNASVSGYRARVIVDPAVSMWQWFQRGAGGNTLDVGLTLSLAVRLDGETCMYVGPFRSGNSVTDDDNTDRGLHALAYEWQPSAADLADQEQEIRRLLSYVTIRRIS